MMIRAATLDDRERILDMALRFIATTRYATLVEPNREQLGALVTKTIEELGIIFVAEAGWVDPQLVGMLALVALPHPFTGVLYADELCWWVEPEHRAGMVGHWLLCAGEDWARQKGLSVLKMVSPAGSDLGTYYERRGYRLVESHYQKTLTE